MCSAFQRIRTDCSRKILTAAILKHAVYVKLLSLVDVSTNKLKLLSWWVLLSIRKKNMAKRNSWWNVRVSVMFKIKSRVEKKPVLSFISRHFWPSLGWCWAFAGPFGTYPGPATPLGHSSTPTCHCRPSSAPWCPLWSTPLGLFSEQDSPNDLFHWGAPRLSQEATPAAPAACPFEQDL